jgi:hypothetical protein
MKFLILNTDYPEYLSWLYGQHPGLEKRSYDEQMRVRVEQCFGVADFYSANLRRLGHEAYEVHFNNEAIQAQWARENGIAAGGGPGARWRLGRVLGALRKRARRTGLRRLAHLMPPFIRLTLPPKTSPGHVLVFEAWAEKRSKADEWEAAQTGADHQ